MDQPEVTRSAYCLHKSFPASKAISLSLISCRRIVLSSVSDAIFFTRSGLIAKTDLGQNMVGRREAMIARTTKLGTLSINNFIAT